MGDPPPPARHRHPPCSPLSLRIILTGRRVASSKTPCNETWAPADADDNPASPVLNYIHLCWKRSLGGHLICALQLRPIETRAQGVDMERQQAFQRVGSLHFL